MFSAIIIQQNNPFLVKHARTHRIRTHMHIYLRIRSNEKHLHRAEKDMFNMTEALLPFPYGRAILM